MKHYPLPPCRDVRAGRFSSYLFPHDADRLSPFFPLLVLPPPVCFFPLPSGDEGRLWLCSLLSTSSLRNVTGRVKFPLLPFPFTEEACALPLPSPPLGSSFPGINKGGLPFSFVAIFFFPFVLLELKIRLFFPGRDRFPFSTS